MVYSFVLRSHLEGQFPQFEWFVGSGESALRIEVINPRNGSSTHAYVPNARSADEMIQRVVSTGRNLVETFVKP